MALKIQENLAQTGLMIARIATLLSPFAIFLALPSFYNGIWVQVEGAMPWLHGVAALAALGCGLAAWNGNEPASESLRHPLVLIPAAVFGLSVVFLPFTTLPGLSLLGAPEHGFGALVYLDLATLTAAARLTVREPRWRTAAVIVSLAVIASAFILDARYRAQRTWAPFFFADYLGFYAVFAFALLVPYVRGARSSLAAVAVLVVLAVLSENKAAILAIVGAAVVVLVIPRLSRLDLGIVSAAFPILIGTMIMVVGTTWQEEYRDAWIGTIRLADVLSSFWASLWSRAMLVAVALQSLLDSPGRLLVGMGWGHYNEALLANLPIVESRLHELIGESRVYWDALQRSDFHSHNQYVEALLSTGVAGLGLLMAYGVAIALAPPSSQGRWGLFVVLVLVGLQSLWFQMPHTVPVMAIALAAFAGWGTPRPTFGLRRGLLAPAAGIAAIVLAVAGASAWNASTHARAALQQVRAGAALASGVGFAAGLGEIYRASLLQAAYLRLNRARPTGGPIDESYLDVLHGLLAPAAEEDGPRGLKLTVSVLNVISGLVFTIPEYEQRFGSLDALFGRTVARLLARAPRRTDLVIPYFNYLLAHGREPEALRTAQTILAWNGQDAVGLWFSGIVLLGNPATADRGMQQLRHSLSRGISNQMPVSRDLLEQIRARQ